MFAIAFQSRFGSLAEARMGSAARRVGVLRERYEKGSQLSAPKTPGHLAGLRVLSNAVRLVSASPVEQEGRQTLTN